MTVPSYASPVYALKFQTSKRGGDPGTDDDIWVTLLDINGERLGARFEVTDNLHGGYGNALKGGSTQTGLYAPPQLNWSRGKLRPVFITVETTGSDIWDCTNIVAQLQYTPPKLETFAALWGFLQNSYFTPDCSVFTFNQKFSTDESEGVRTATVAENAFRPGGHQSGASESTSTTFAIINNARGTSETPATKADVTKVDTDTISIVHGSGSENDHSITVGVKAGFEAEGVSAEISETASVAWKEWAAKTNTRVYSTQNTRQQEVVAEAPAHTVRIMEWTVTFEVSVFTVSNGIGPPVRMDIVPEQDLLVPSPTITDINESQKISEADWTALRERMILNRTISNRTVNQAAETLRSCGWIT